VFSLSPFPPLPLPVSIPHFVEICIVGVERCPLNWRLRVQHALSMRASRILNSDASPLVAPITSWTDRTKSFNSNPARRRKRHWCRKFGMARITIIIYSNSPRSIQYSSVSSMSSQNFACVYLSLRPPMGASFDWWPLIVALSGAARFPSAFSQVSMSVLVISPIDI
jgi:hypothetical protein